MLSGAAQVSSLRTTCSQWHPYDALEKHNGKRGLRWSRRCTICRRKAAAMRTYNWRKRYPDRAKAAAQRTNAKSKARQAAWYQANKSRLRELERRRRLAQKGITPEQYITVLTEQANACAICRRADVELVPDHDHGTQQFRGILCRTCNAAIAWFLEQSAICEAAAVYLRRFGK